MRQIYFVLPLLAMVLAGCDRTTIVHRDNATLRLHGFYLVDSFGNSNEFSGVHLKLDPAVDGGIFELYWDVESFYDYTVTISINDQPDLYGAMILSSELCGPERACDYEGGQICQYFRDFTMGCGLDLWEAEHYREPVEHLMGTVPYPLFINIEVCDDAEFYCELDSVEVLAF